MDRSLAASVATLLLIGLPADGAEMPKRGGTLLGDCMSRCRWWVSDRSETT
jgi:hypothetical protein